MSMTIAKKSLEYTENLLFGQNNKQLLSNFEL